MISFLNIMPVLRGFKRQHVAVEARVIQDGAQGHRERPWAFFIGGMRSDIMQGGAADVYLFYVKESRWMISPKS